MDRDGRDGPFTQRLCSCGSYRTFDGVYFPLFSECSSSIFVCPIPVQHLLLISLHIVLEQRVDAGLLRISF